MRIHLGADGAPLHEQIAAAVRRAIADGTVSPGERLPVARDLATQLDVNVNTVLRAYRTLQDERLVELRRGRGATVIGRVEVARMTAQVDRVVAEARRVGMADGELLALVRDRMR